MCCRFCDLTLEYKDSEVDLRSYFGISWRRMSDPTPTPNPGTAAPQPDGVAGHQGPFGAVGGPPQPIERPGWSVGLMAGPGGQQGPGGAISGPGQPVPAPGWNAGPMAGFGPFGGIRVHDIVDRFDGSGDVLVFLQQLRKAERILGINDLAGLASLYVAGHANFVVEQLRSEQKKDFNEVERALVEAFAPDVFEAYEMFSERKWIPGEPVDVFMIELRRLGSRAAVPESMYRLAFMKGLPKEVSSAIKSTRGSKFFTAQEILEMARSLIVRCQPGRVTAAVAEPEPVGEATGPPQVAAAAKPNKKKKRKPPGPCWNCGELHWREECTKPPRENSGNASGLSQAPQPAPGYQAPRYWQHSSQSTSKRPSRWWTQAVLEPFWSRNTDKQLWTLQQEYYGFRWGSGSVCRGSNRRNKSCGKKVTVKGIMVKRIIPGVQLILGTDGSLQTRPKDLFLAFLFFSLNRLVMLQNQVIW